MKGHSRGFSLIELTVLLAIASIIAIGLLNWVQPAQQSEAEKVAITRQRLQTIEEALEAFRINYQRLPCAASHALPDTDTGVGLEDCDTGFSQAVNAAELSAGDASANCETTVPGAENYGAVPVRTLSIPYENMLDGWGRRFTYHVSTSLCTVGSCDGDYPPSDYAYFNAAHVGDITVKTTDPTSGNDRESTSEAAYVVFSHGSNGNCAWLPNGKQRPALGQADASWLGAINATSIADGEAENLDWEAGSVYWADIYSAQYDDIFVFKTKAQLESGIQDYE